MHGKALSILELKINSKTIVTGMSINTLILFEKWREADFSLTENESDLAEWLDNDD